MGRELLPAAALVSLRDHKSSFNQGELTTRLYLRLYAEGAKNAIFRRRGQTRQG
jgi:hypothetical protein